MKFFRVLLFPFAWLYDLVTRLRNYLYNSGYKTSFEFDRFLISVGNLSVGGTGKTPMVEYLIRLLDSKTRLATLSRGYGRKTRGFRIADSADTAATIGDEPLQYFKKFNIPVTVGEERAVAVPFILAEFPDTGIILLDDAFQHRAVKPKMNILLTAFDRPFFEDYVLPAGRLREARKGASRADIIVVTKCPETLSAGQKIFMEGKIQKYAPGIPVFYSTIDYGEVRGGNSRLKKVIVVTGIANPELFISHVKHNYEVVEIIRFPDHHQFSDSEIRKIADTAGAANAMVLTTEKDYMRITAVKQDIINEQAELMYIPIEMKFLENGSKFDRMIVDAYDRYASEG